MITYLSYSLHVIDWNIGNEVHFASQYINSNASEGDKIALSMAKLWSAYSPVNSSKLEIVMLFRLLLSCLTNCCCWVVVVDVVFFFGGGVILDFYNQENR